jgi:hypothetical protein
MNYFVSFSYLFFSGEIVSKPVNPLTDNYKAKVNVQTSVREGLQEYKNLKDIKRQSSKTSISSETSRVQN